MQHHPHPPLLTVPEVARMLSVSPATVWRRVADRTLPHVKIGTCTRIHRDTVEELIERAKTGTRDAA